MKNNEQHGKFNHRGEVRLVRTLPGPIERIWEYLTDSEKRARWFAGGPMEPRKGGKFTLKFRQINLSPDETPPEEYKKHHDPGHEMEGLITRWDPPHALGFTFGSDGESEVLFELKSQGETVLLVVTHTARDGDIPYITEFATGWHTHLAHLIAEVEGLPRPKYWAMHAKLTEDYRKLLQEIK